MTGHTVDDVAFSAVLQATGNPRTGPVVCPDPGLGARLAAEGRQVLADPLDRLPDEHAAAVVLTADEASLAGEGAEGIMHAAARVLGPGGLLALTVRNRVFMEITGLPSGARGFSATELERLLGHHGFRSTLLCAPGAAGRLKSTLSPDLLAGDAPLDVDADRDPGLLHAAPRLFALAERAPDLATRSERFFATLPRKVLAAAVLCRTDDGRMLVVHDTFKQHWTIPGGVVDPDENPRAGAEREAWEEAGVRVAAGAVLGVFAATWPDRIVLVYDGVPVGGGTPAAEPVHAHEIDAAEWLEVSDALERLAPHVAFQVRRCLAEPGGTWEQPRA